MEYIVEIASANEVDIRGMGNQPDDEEAEKYPSDKWESVAHGRTPLEVLETLLENANAEEFDISNSWLRLITIDKNGKTKVRTY
jgi:hypothetical protein